MTQLIDAGGKMAASMRAVLTVSSERMDRLLEQNAILRVEGPVLPQHDKSAVTASLQAVAASLKALQASLRVAENEVNVTTGMINSPGTPNTAGTPGAAG